MIFHLPEAHALVAKQDLPIPAWLFAWAASIVLVVSFFALSAAWRKPRFEEERWRPSAAWMTAVLRSWPLQILCGGLGVFLLGVGIYSGIHGTEAPDRNFAITFFFVTVWIGFAFASALIGDVFPIFNPWRAIARVAGGAYSLVSRRRLPHLAYPERLGRWPAAVGLLGFVWLEVVYGSSGGVAVGLEPHAAGVGACVYSVYTLTMMALFGTEVWCSRGE
ncbi:MAG TPA: fenitrothion hydrolase, partial [Solirubrobacterales bacterium]|nr:fenitrothion hydrolase [Solirubrobacterales bacterium]